MAAASLAAHGVSIPLWLDGRRERSSQGSLGRASVARRWQSHAPRWRMLPPTPKTVAAKTSAAEDETDRKV